MNELQELINQVKALKRKMMEIPLHSFQDRALYHELRCEIQDLSDEARQCYKAWELTGVNLQV